MLRRSFAAALLAAAAASGLACHRMATVSQPAQFIEGAKPPRIWVTRPSGETFIVDGPQLFGDTLVGYVNGEYRELDFAGTETVVVRRPARAQTVALVAVGIGATALFGALISGGGTSGNPRANQDCDDDPDQPGCE